MSRQFKDLFFSVNFASLQQYTLHKFFHALPRTVRRRSENKNPRQKNFMTFTKNTTFQFFFQRRNTVVQDLAVNILK